MALRLLYKLVCWIERLLLQSGALIIQPMKKIKRKRLLNLSKGGWEYVRHCSLELVAHEIESKNLKGSVAEVGVYRGGFAKRMNEVFQHRKFYLFDTFEGFDKQDVQVEQKEGFSTGKQDFADTSIERVLSKMKYRDNCIVRKGYFPETAKGIEDEFVFVSLDADLFNPIYEGLQYFFPRLVNGGYIFIHDYNNFEYEGVQKAVHRFCKENNLNYFPLCDVFGTVVIAK